MHKYIVVILIILLMFTSCSKIDEKAPAKTEPISNQPKQGINISPQEEATDNQGENDYLHFGQYQMSEEGFSEKVKDNAIDRDYAFESNKFQHSSEFSTQGWVELGDKYYQLWDKELNNIYNKLLKKLNENEHKKLTEAQKGWLQFHMKESEFVVESWDKLGLGSQGRVQLEMSAKDRIRERTLQLMEYYYMLGGDVEFLYKGNDK